MSMDLIVSVPASESISNSLLGDLQAPDQKAMAMNQMARDVLRDGSCVNLQTLECDQGAQFRSSNGSCNNMERPHQVGEVVIFKTDKMICIMVNKQLLLFSRVLATLRTGGYCPLHIQMRQWASGRV